MNDLYSGAEVRFRATGARGRVVDPGRYTPADMMIARRGEPPKGVLVELESGARVDVARAEIDPVEPQYPYRGEPDASLAQWLLDQLDNWHTTPRVSAFVPRSYEAVARVMHESGRDEGELDGERLRVLIDALRPATGTPDDVLFVVWEGWGGDPWDRFPDAAHVEPTSRTSRLLRGPIDCVYTPINPMMAAVFGNTMRPLVWWPADRAWVVHTEVDLPWTWVAGAEQLVDAVCSRPELAAVRTSFDAVSYET